MGPRSEYPAWGCRLVERHGGRIEATKHPHSEGATFWITLPLTHLKEGNNTEPRSHEPSRTTDRDPDGG